MASGAGDLPGAVDAVAGLVAGLRVLGPVVQRPALVGPLLLAVVARDDAVVAHRLGRCRRAISGGQLVAHGPLQVDLPLPTASRSKV